jgi:hypothetical protein
MANRARDVVAVALPSRRAFLVIQPTEHGTTRALEGCGGQSCLIDGREASEVVEELCNED